MSGTEPTRYSTTWLGHREGADAEARSSDLIAALVPRLLGEAVGDLAGEAAGEAAGRGAGRSGEAGRGPIVVHDLGCGTGSMGRWLAARLPGPQRWVLHDRDPELLEHAAAGMAVTAADGSPVEVEVRLGDVTALTSSDLAGAGLVTASALLDLLTGPELERLAAACVGVGCPALLTLSVTGEVELTPADPLDAGIAEAFNAHQRRTVDGRRLLGPDAVGVAVEAFTALGAEVRISSSPWRLSPERAGLTAEWLRGWVGAAHEQRPELAVGDYLRRRSERARTGRLRARVGHADLLALPRNSSG